MAMSLPGSRGSGGDGAGASRFSARPVRRPKHGRPAVAQPRGLRGRGADREPKPGSAGRAGADLRARFAVIGDPAHYTALKDALAGSGIEAAAAPKRSPRRRAAVPTGSWRRSSELRGWRRRWPRAARRDSRPRQQGSAGVRRRSVMQEVAPAARPCCRSTASTTRLPMLRPRPRRDDRGASC